MPSGRSGDGRDPDAEDWWFRTRASTPMPADSGEEVVLRFDGLASVSEVHLNGELILLSDSMFTGHEVDVGEPAARQQRASNPLPAPSRRSCSPSGSRGPAGGRSSSRTAICASSRASIFGRAPGFSPGPAPVGPWRAISIERRTERRRRGAGAATSPGGRRRRPRHVRPPAAAIDGETPSEDRARASGSFRRAPRSRSGPRLVTEQLRRARCASPA